MNAWPRILLSVLVLYVGLGVPASTWAETLFVRAGKIYTLAGPPLSPGQMLVRDGKIAAIGTDLEAPAGATILDLKDTVLIPGLVNAYSQAGVHAGASELTREITPNFRVAAAVDWRAREFKEALAAGTTSIAIAPDTQAVIGGAACVMKTAGATKAQRMVRDDVGLFFTTSGDPGRGNSSRNRPDSIYNRLPTNRMGVIWLLRQQFTQARLHGEDQEQEPLRQVLAGERPAFVIARAQFEISSLFDLNDELGIKRCILVEGYEAHTVAKDLAQRKIPVLLDGRTSSTASRGDFDQAFWNQPVVLQRANVPFALTGDDLLEQARFAHRRGLPAEVALAAITKTPAEILEIAERVGRLAPGMDADFLALDGEPLDFSTAIRLAAVGGKVIEFRKDR